MTLCTKTKQWLQNLPILVAQSDERLKTKVCVGMVDKCEASYIGFIYKEHLIEHQFHYLSNQTLD